MIRFQIAAIVPMRKYHIIVQELIQRQIGRVSTITMHDNESHLGRQSYELHKIARLDAFPDIVEARPGRDAMEITHLARLRQCAKLLVVEPQLRFCLSDQPEIPSCPIETRSRTITQDRKLVGQRLTGRETIDWFHSTHQINQ